MSLSKKKISLIQYGFSLIELLVVVAIIGILAGIGIFAYDSYVEYSRRAVNEANAKLLAAAFIAERTIQIGKLPGRVCTSNITRFDGGNHEPFLSCLNTLVQVNKITNPYTGNIYNMANLNWFHDAMNAGTLNGSPMPDTPIANSTYIEEGYEISGGECSDVGGIVATYPSSVNKPFIATCKFFPDTYQTRGYKFFSLVE